MGVKAFCFVLVSEFFAALIVPPFVDATSCTADGAGNALVCFFYTNPLITFGLLAAFLIAAAAVPE